MEQIIVAVIGAVAVVIAAVIGVRWRRDKAQKTAEPAQSVKNVSGSSTVVLSGRDSYVVQQSHDRALSDEALAALRKIADELISNPAERSAWGSFNAEIWKECFEASPGGIVLDNRRFQERVIPANTTLLKRSAKIYLKAARLFPDTGRGDGDILIRLATLYTKAVLGSHGIDAEPSSRGQLQDYAPLWDGTEVGWCLIKVKAPKDPRLRMVIYNVNDRRFERIDDLDLHAQVVERMSAAGVPVIDQIPG